MEKSFKIALSGFLVIGFFSLFFYIETGTVIIPHLLFGFIELFVVIALLIQDNTDRWKYLPLLLVVVLRCLKNPLTYSFFMHDSEFSALANGFYLDFIGLAEFLAMILLIRFTVGWHSLLQKIVSIGLCALFAALQFFPSTLWYFAFFPVFTIVLIASKIKHPSIPALGLIAVFDVLTAYDILIR
jgi:hypothetical protein